MFSCNLRFRLIFLHGCSRTHCVASLRAVPVGRISYNLYFDCKHVRSVTCDLINEYTSSFFFLMITRSIVQDSGLGPYLYILLARRLKLLSVMNAIVKYADDTTLVVPQHTDCSVEAELQYIANWSCDNKQTINTSKTKEIIFWKFGKSTKHYNIPLIPNIERVDQVKLLGVLLTSNLSSPPPY